MSAAARQDDFQIRLVEIIDFKWLMAGYGHKVHVQRLQTDAAYAQDCLRCGAGSHVPALREAARRLAAAMGVALATPGPDAGPAAPTHPAAEPGPLG